MSEPGRTPSAPQAIAAAMAAVIERAETDLSPAEEPAGFLAALEAAAPADAEAAGAGKAPARAAVPGGQTLAAVAVAIRTRALSPVAAAQACLDRIAAHDGRLHAFVGVDAARALDAARRLEAEATAGRLRGPLHGVPLAHKDLFVVAGWPTSCGTKTAEYLAAVGPSTAVARLEAAGALTLGKLNMSELALGPFGDNPHHGDCQNPWRPGHCAGGSSSGSGAAVAAGLALGALGSDTGGSIRLPAACCGIAGLKPTYGRVSRAGAMILSWSMDHVGPMAATVEDVALLLAAIAGHDPLDATSSRLRVPDYVAGFAVGVRGLRVGVPENYYFDRVQPEMAAAVRAAARAIEGLGAHVMEMRVPDPAPVNDVAQIMSRAEAAVVHARVLRERPHELGATVRARLETGTRVSAHDYIQAQRLRSRLARQFIEAVFSEVDLLVAPVIPEPAPALAVATGGAPEAVAARMGEFSRLTRPFNGLGLPALAVPCGRSADGLPLALQIVGRPFDEATVLRLGHAYQQATAWPPARPTL